MVEADAPGIHADRWKLDAGEIAQFLNASGGGKYMTDYVRICAANAGGNLLNYVKGVARSNRPDIDTDPNDFQNWIACHVAMYQFNLNNTEFQAVNAESKVNSEKMYNQYGPQNAQKLCNLLTLDRNQTIYYLQLPNGGVVADGVRCKRVKVNAKVMIVSVKRACLSKLPPAGSKICTKFTKDELRRIAIDEEGTRLDPESGYFTGF